MHRGTLIVMIVLFGMLVMVLPTGVLAQGPQSTPPPPSQDPYGSAYIEAGRLLEQAWGLDPVSRKGALSKAAQQFTEAMKASPGNVSARINRGAIYIELGLYDQAIADLSSALSTSPNSIDALKNRAVARERKGDLCEALNDSQSFLNAIQGLEGDRRGQERVDFAAKVKVLQNELKQKAIPCQTTRVGKVQEGQSTPPADMIPNIWVWADWYGQAKTYNDTYGGVTYPNLPGWVCEALHPGHNHENVVWFQLPSTINRTAWALVAGTWTQLWWEHYYASDRGWTPYGSNNYFLMVPDTEVCLGYNPPPSNHRIHGQRWE